ncbi:ATP-binding cassette domain-containing protein [Lactobacillus delbrueckii subsp. allosunkii]|uniref:ABC transporter ATP-binding protein/permease n=1 Tax=Lactobacillus delbrueckii subsp. allosunkii TaxID=1050107 RepID=A0ABD4SA49_9LACO|nr:ATP-binding cassette domain-containing protein [Lactobacillus delbrueckii]MCD5517654.1 ABC transporter ATP-binding protein/permease [Lactobacillus delbrueckii subsp. sunkii]MCZ0776703.1 ATP-binding cassette domain-containing protein [Lactobacillus delbrueckii subsp. sunkii]MCZ0787755.1 ATP-binding cassette domain-containing protein [Lactobacillus delbrueckii subsp. sunkii]MCZ0794005.1 ATP-binding cassette domain-containing protein [Lactobacillus delbrueckii]
MIKLRKYILPYLLPILLAIAFIFGEAQTELALPDYMGDIVTNGIQAGGFKDSVADVLSPQTYRQVMTYSTKAHQQTIKDSYRYVKAADVSNDLKQTFPKGKNLYVLKKNVDRDKLNTAMLRGMILYYTLTGNKNSDTSKKFLKNISKAIKTAKDKYAKGEKAYQQLAKVAAVAPQAVKMKAQLDQAKKQIDAMETAYQKKDLAYFFKQMSTKQKQKIYDSIDKQMKKMGTSTMNMAGSRAVKLEYKRLGASTSKLQTSYIKTAGLKMLGIALLGSVVTILAGLLASRVGAGVARDLRLALFEKVESFSNTEMDRFSTASLITRSTNDITQIQQVIVLMIRMVAYAPILGIGALLHALDSSPSMTWIIGLVILLIFIILMITMGLAMPKFKIVQKLIDKLNLSMRENLTGMLVIRAFGNEKVSEDRFDESNRNLTKVNLFTNRVMSTLMPVMMFIMNTVALVIVYAGAKQIDLGKLQIGSMMAFVQYAMMIIMAFLMVAMIAIFIPRASISAGRVAEVLETEVEIESPAESKSSEENTGVIFDDVTFTYPGSQEAALEHISFTAPAGKTTAFIGSTGSGKSSLINLIPRFYDVTSGKVTVDGIDVKDYDLQDLRERIGLVPQKGQLLTGTVKSNVLYGAKDDSHLAEALRVSQSEEFVDRLPGKLEAPIAQGGSNVSGGQRQRLAIARALAKDPEILVFDDSFSALDFKTDAKVRLELTKMAAKEMTTVLLVGQRIASIMDADQIIVLDEGKIVGKGKHQDLLKNCQVYREIAYSQLSKEELADA